MYLHGLVGSQVSLPTVGPQPLPRSFRPSHCRHVPQHVGALPSHHALYSSNGSNRTCTHVEHTPLVAIELHCGRAHGTPHPKIKYLVFNKQIMCFGLLRKTIQLHHLDVGAQEPSRDALHKTSAKLGHQKPRRQSKVGGRSWGPQNVQCPQHHTPPRHPLHLCTPYIHRSTCAQGWADDG